METNNLISKLVEDGHPVRPIPRFGWRLLFWAGGVTLILGTAFLVTGVRRDARIVAADARLWLDSLNIFLLVPAAIWGTLKLSVPGEAKRIHRILPLGLLAFWVISTAGQMLLSIPQAGLFAVLPDPHVICALIIGLLAGATGILTFALIKKAAPLNSRWSGALAGLSSGSAAMIGIELICHHNQTAHMFYWHVIPVAVVTVAGALFGPKLIGPADSPFRPKNRQS